MPVTAYISSYTHDTTTERFSQLVVHVNYRRGDAQINMHLSPPSVGQSPAAAAAQELEELSKVLHQIAEKPSAIMSRGPQSKQP